MRVVSALSVKNSEISSNKSVADFYEDWDNEEEEKCPSCKGTGMDRWEEFECETCFGEGYISAALFDFRA